jgi:carboxyl-terminal processing protease
MPTPKNAPLLRTARLLTLVGLISTMGCATASSLPTDQAPLVVTGEALTQTGAYYLWPDRLDQRMVVGALDGLEQSFDSVLFESEENATEGVLTVNGESVVIPLDPTFDADEYQETLARAIGFTQARLPDPIDPEDDLEHIALRGALGALDRYTTVYSGRGSEDFRIRFEGKLSGIGARIGRRDGDLIAVRVFPGSPADRSGLKDGDAILFIDGDPTRPLSVEEAVGRIRGRSGTPVSLGLERGGVVEEGKEATEPTTEKQRLDITITRGEVMVPSVTSKPLEGARRIGYAQVDQVSRETAQEFRERLHDLGPIDGLVLDLRGNTGGSMIAAAQLADEFLDSQMIVRTVTRDGLPPGASSQIAADREIEFDMPLAILVDGQTASAAEIISGALQPLGNVTLVGQNTFGKGLVQQVLTMKDENLLKLTVAEYLLSADRAINEKGIAPKVPLYPVPEARLGSLANVPAGAIPYVRGKGEDDAFPVEVGAAILREPEAQALDGVRKRAYADIAKHLGALGVPWSTQRGPTDTPLPQPLVIAVQAPTLVSGETGRVRISVTNPNDFELPDVWLALDAPAEYLDNKVAGLGALGPGATISTELELHPPDGISVEHHPIDVLVAAGDRPLAKHRAVLDVTAQPAQLEIEVVPVNADDVKLVLVNKSAHAARSLTVAVPGATRSFEVLEPGQREEMTLPLSANPKTIIVAQLGPWAQRRVEVPIPQTATTYAPPEVVIGEHAEQVQLTARSPLGLRDGWIAVDGQKKSYSDFANAREGTLEIPLGSGEHNVVSKVETADGVSVIDVRQLTRE